MTAPLYKRGAIHRRRVVRPAGTKKSPNGTALVEAASSGRRFVGKANPLGYADERDELIEELAQEVERLATELESRDAVSEAQDVMLVSALGQSTRLREDKRAANTLADFYRRFGPRD